MKIAQVIKKFFDPIKSQLPTIYLIAFLAVISGIVEFGWGFSAKYILDAIGAKDVHNIIVYILIFGLLVIIRHTLNLYQGKLYSINGSTVKSLLQQKYIHQYLISDNNKVESVGSGKFSSIIRQGIDSSKLLIDLGYSTGIDMAVSLILGFAIIFYHSFIFGFIVLGVCLLVFFIAKRQEKILLPLKKLNKDCITELDKHMLKSIQTKFEIIQSSKIDYETNIIGSIQDAIRSRGVRIYLTRQVYIRLPAFLVDVCTLVGYYFLGMGIINGTYTIGTFALFTMVAGKFRDYLRWIGEINTQIAEHMIHISKLWDTFDKVPEIKNYYNGLTYKPGNGKIEINNLSYGYDPARPIFSNFSLTIAGGSKVALVGSSGSGKTTLVKLISGYLHTEDNCGDVYIDNQNIKDISLKSFYKHIGYLTQDPSVFDGTILENLTYGIGVGTHGNVSDDHSNVSDDHSNVSDDHGNVSDDHGNVSDHSDTSDYISPETIESIIHLSQCQFIYNLPDGLDTHIGEKGVKLSGGQRQRLAIAKLMIKNPQIIILDEPTSALDSFAEDEVTKALDNLLTNKTVIIIAHRLQTVKKADRIIVLGDAGVILEEGTHDHLVANQGTYAKMLELQSGF